MIGISQIKFFVDLCKQWKGTLSVLGVIPTVVVSVFYVMGWLNSTYASVETVNVIKAEQAAFSQQLKDINTENEINRLEQLIEETGDKIYTLRRQIERDGPNARESDRQQLDNFQRRLERYKRDLERIQ